MGILCLKLDNQVGFAVGSFGHLVSGICNLKGARTDDERVGRLFRRIGAIHAAYPIRQVFIEAHNSSKRPDPAPVHAGLLPALLTWCAERGIALHAIEPTKIRKSFILNGHGSKDDLVAEARKRGFGIWGVNEAIALAMFDHVVRPHGLDC